MSGWYDVTNRVVVTNGAIVRSINGPSVTFIRGFQVPALTAMTNAVRCVYLGSTSVLSGFTLTNGSAGSGNYVNGGGVFCGFNGNCVVSNCIFAGNYAAGAGGGMIDGKAFNCVFTGNFGQGGGAADGTQLINCIITNNTAGWAGGILSGSATNCLFAFNRATNYAGAVGFATLVNCTVVSNSLQAGLGGNGGGTYKATVYNSIVSGNSAPNGNNYYSSTVAYTCTTPLPPGAGNFDDTPLFANAAGGDYRPAFTSPCINAGQNAFINLPTDLGGDPRIRGATVDAGAYEYQNPVSTIAYHWLQRFNLPLNGSTDNSDPDQDGATNWQEWRAGTAPNDSTSVLKLLAPVMDAQGVTLTWQSVPGVLYSVQCCTNLLDQPPFQTVQTNISGQPGTTSFTDTGISQSPARLYRVQAQ